EVPSPIAGTVKSLKANEGDIVPIETPLLELEVGGQSVAAKKETKVSAAAPVEVSKKSAEKSSAPPSNGVQSSQEVFPPVAAVHVLATPSTRKLAREMQVDINQISGTGLAGRVTREDLMGFKGSTSTSSPAYSTPGLPTFSYSPSAEEEVELVPLRGIRRKIAQQMQLTKQIVPHFTLMDEADVTELVKFRTQAKQVGEKYGVKITYLPFVMKALIATIREFPMFNATIDDQNEQIIYKKYFNIGFAADTPNGLLVPVVKAADRKNMIQISHDITDLATRAREGKLKPEEMKGATITITNIGSVGGNYATPIINHPEVAILGMYKIVDKPVMKNGKFRAAKVMNFTITADHRLIDGAVAANFLNAFLRRLENPSHLMLDMI
ncbi:MAG: 2-oxo acid dehydrogenase subunit E2, partial [Bdellovibrionales bacterium]|nr:2-oxo acid dehydrogenase subunit E2 [Bdellovibrionales bacterium]